MEHYTPPANTHCGNTHTSHLQGSDCSQTRPASYWHRPHPISTLNSTAMATAGPLPEINLQHSATPPHPRLGAALVTSGVSIATTTGCRNCRSCLEPNETSFSISQPPSGAAWTPSLPHGTSTPTSTTVQLQVLSLNSIEAPFSISQPPPMLLGRLQHRQANQPPLPQLWQLSSVSLHPIQACSGCRAMHGQFRAAELVFSLLEPASYLSRQLLSCRAQAVPCC